MPGADPGTRRRPQWQPRHSTFSWAYSLRSRRRCSRSTTRSSRTCPSRGRRAESPSARPRPRRCSRRGTMAVGSFTSSSASTRSGSRCPTPPNCRARPAPGSRTCARSSSGTSEISHRRPERAHEQRVREGLQRGQAPRYVTARRTPRSDAGRDLLAGQRSGDLEPRLPHARDEQELTSSKAHAARDDEPAAADGSIGCWNDKYYWSFWRPITAIHEAENDGNPATEPDPAWLPLFTPPVPRTTPRATLHRAERSTR